MQIFTNFRVNFHETDFNAKKFDAYLPKYLSRSIDSIDFGEGKRERVGKCPEKDTLFIYGKYSHSSSFIFSSLESNITS